MSDNIKVVVKVRPLISREVEEKLSYQWRVKSNTLVQLDQNGKGLGTTFTFDKVYDKETNTSEVYNDVAKPIVEAAIKGFNGTIFAYGQTSSGKTYTMSGTEDTPGIIPRAVIDLFERIKQIPDRDFLVRVSYIEIYNEMLQDLLNIEKKNIKVHETLQGVKVDVTENVVVAPEEVFEAMKEGEANRQTGATYMNEESSRSHSIFQIIIESREHTDGEEDEGCVNVSQLNLVDLAGSERAGQTGATGIRFKEGTHINKSLSTLALVIKQLSENATNPAKYINYRDSKLTRILQNSLGGNAKTSIICAITPASVEETISTLQFANRAKAIRNKPEVNAVATNATMIQSLTKQLSELQSQLEGKKNLEQDNANLQKQISNMQKLILNGFGQNRTIDLLSQNRRKMQQLRRVTISTLHPIKEAEDVIPAIPKFCTPSLKYNPLSLPPSDFAPIQPSTSSTSSLGIVSEETDRMITPPLRGPNVQDEIISLDDSDDLVTEMKTCSPYHKCYNQSKTPPCVLRKNASIAEENYQTLVEHTEREKIYAPDTLELLERLEHNTDTISKLKEELETVKGVCGGKDIEITDLKKKVLQNEEEVKNIALAKTSLEKQCEELTVKLTDLEVSYETLQNKSKKREEELLLLLEEEKSLKKTESRMSREINFMDLSKDISLVNSDTENSVIAPVDVDSSAQIKELVIDLQARLNDKTDMILKLESNLYAEKQKIESLENSIAKVNLVVDGLNSEVPRLENEKSLLQSTIETLNTTIDNQKENFEIINKDIQSYNSTIQELQIKLSKKEKLPNVIINDSMLEAMIANEEKFLANNENMKNIVHSFKLILESRNKEVEQLKAQLQNESELLSNNSTLKDDVESKAKYINTLIDEIEKIKDQLSENSSIIERLMANEKELSTKLVETQDQNDTLRKENEDGSLQINNLEKINVELTYNVQELKFKFSSTEDELAKSLSLISDLEENGVKLDNIIDNLNSKLANIEIKNDLLKKENEKLAQQITQLEECNKKLNDLVTEKENLETEIKTKHDILIKDHEEISHKIIELEKEIALKHEETKIQTLLEEKNVKQLVKFKLILMKVQDLLYSLDNKLWVSPEHVKDLEDILDALTDGMDNVQVSTQLILEERNKIIEDNIKIKQELSDLVSKYQDLTVSSNNSIDSLQNSNSEILKQNEKLEAEAALLKASIETLQQQLDTQNGTVIHLEEQLNDLKESVRDLERQINYSSECVAALEKQLCDSKDSVTDLERRLSDASRSDTDLERQLNDAKDSVTDLEGQLNDAKESYENLRNDLCSKENIIITFEEKVLELECEIKTLSMKSDNIIHLENEITDLVKQLTEKEEHFTQTLAMKDDIISNINIRMIEMKKMLESKQEAIDEATEKVSKAEENYTNLFNGIFNEILKLLKELNLDIEPFEIDRTGDIVYRRIIDGLDKLSKIIPSVKSQHEIELERQIAKNIDVTNVLAQAKRDIAELTEKNLQLMDEVSSIDRKNIQLMDEMSSIDRKTQDMLTESQSVEDLSQQLLGTSDLLISLKSELAAKASEIGTMESKALEFKDKFIELQSSLQGQIVELQLENDQLRAQIYEVSLNSKRQINTPLSLSTICAQNIIEAMRPSDNTNVICSTTSNMVPQDAQTQVNTCDCADLFPKLRDLMLDNTKLVETLQEVQTANKLLVEEQERVREEIHLLVEPASELQKRLVNHKTNLSTLAATTFAENKLLQTQLKVLRHHHTRYTNICQRDIPNFKAQLCELMMILNDNESFMENHSLLFKRYSLPDILDSNASMMNFKNESTLDGDLLMIDTNLTLASAESTIMLNDQTCLDLTQINESEVSWLNLDTSKAVNLCSEIDCLENDDKKLMETLNELKDKNNKLKQQFEQINQSPNKVESQTSIDTYNSCNTEAIPACQNYKLQKELLEVQENMTEQIKVLTQDLEDMKLKKLDIEMKYADLTLEIPATDALVKKLSSLEQDHSAKVQEMLKLNSDLTKKAKFIKALQDENDQLSTQVMESISEVDDLKKELDSLKELNAKREQLASLQNIPDSQTELKSKCSDCALKDDIINSLKSKTPDVRNSNISNLSLNRSLSDSHSTSRLNKICTLRNELHESKEDCKKINEDVVTVKNLLDRSNLSMQMDLDESMSYDTATNNTSNVEKPDLYTYDKMECLKFYIEKTGEEKENFSSDVKLIDVLKSFYNNLVSKHSEEVENLTNMLQEFYDSKTQLQVQFDDVTIKYETLNKLVESKGDGVEKTTKILANIQTNIDLINEEMEKTIIDKDSKLVTLFKDSILNMIDNEFNISTSSIFDTLINAVTTKTQEKIDEIDCRYKSLQMHAESVEAVLNSVTENLKHAKAQLTTKETEYNLLNSQKQKIQEISNAVTLDIVNKEKELKHIFKSGYEQLVEINVIGAADIDLTLSVHENIGQIFQKLKDMKQQNFSVMDTEKNSLISEVVELKNVIKQKDLELSSMKTVILQKEQELSAQISANEDRDKQLQRNLEETKTKLEEFEKTTKKTIDVLKDTVIEKEQTIMILEGKINENAGGDVKSLEFVHKIEELIKENDSLKSVNTVITKEKEQVALELVKCSEVINVEKVELDKLAADIMALQQTVKENVSIIETLKTECKGLHEQNELFKSKAEEKVQESRRLTLNIKTLEKTAEVQTKIISRLHKQRDEDEKAAKEKDDRLDELTQKCLQLKKDFEDVSDTLQIAKVEIEELKSLKMQLEERVSQLEMTAEDGHKRQSLDTIVENSHRRRQSVFDSKRLFVEDKLNINEHNKMEAMFESRTKPDDLFMDVDGDSGQSNRSTPVRHSGGRDSLFKQDVSDPKDDEPHSRPSSVLATRRRRQSIHDLHRSALRNTPSPHYQPRLSNDSNPEAVNLKPESLELLAATQRELEELKERYRELDEECETCAEYLHEREAQCVALRKDKKALEEKVVELNARLKANPNASHGEFKHRFADASVNTDEDQPRLSNDSNPGAVNLKPESLELLAATQRELEELKERYRELDEECETCAEYLHEREAQCVALRKDKKALEEKVVELNARLKANPNASHGEFKHRFADASVNTDEDWANLHSVVVDRMSFDAEVEKNKKLVRTIEELRYKNQDLKNTLQNTIDKYSSHKDVRQLEMARSELHACRKELEELKEKYKELDEECETCAEYLKEREEQCRKLKEAKAALEAQLEQYEGGTSSLAQSARKRRQSLHDQNRTPAVSVDFTDANTNTETSEDFLNYQVVRDTNAQHEIDPATLQEAMQLKHTMDKLMLERAKLEARLMVIHPAMLLNAGSAIVQSQQITNMSKENQRLKRVNARLMDLYKRGKSRESRSKDNRENENPGQMQ